MRRELADRRVLITGASSGIGRALARELAARGARLLLLARREELLQQLHAELAPSSGAILISPGDVTEPADRARALAQAEAAWGAIDVLVNNAGIGAIGSFATGDAGRLRRIMEVNFFAVAELSREALPLLKRGQQPVVVNISSILGLCGLPDYADYCASKFALEGLSTSLRREWRTADIDVLMVNPGTTRSEFFDHLLTHEGPLAKRGGAPPGVPAEVVARQIAQAIERGRRQITPSASGRWLVRAERYAPRLVDWVLSRML